MRTRRTASWLVVVGASTLVLGGCVYSAEPAPGSPDVRDTSSTEGFPPPGPPPVPGQITPGPVAPPAPPDAPRPEFGPVPTEGPVPSAEVETSDAPAPPPGS